MNVDHLVSKPWLLLLAAILLLLSLGEIRYPLEYHAASIKECLEESRKNNTGLWYDHDSTQIQCLRKKCSKEGHPLSQW